MQSDNLEEWYAIKLCFKLEKNSTETYGMLQTAFRPSYMNRASVFVWHKRLKEGRESVRDDERRGRSKEEIIILFNDNINIKDESGNENNEGVLHTLMHVEMKGQGLI